MPSDPSNEALGLSGPGCDATDEELLSAFLRGKEIMFDELLQRHQGPLYGFICRLTGSPSDAPDLFQETFVRVVKHAGSFEGRSSFKTWLYTIACNVCRSYQRKARVGPTVTSDLPDNKADRSLDPSDAADSAEIGRHVARAVDALPEAQREVLVLKVYEGMSYPDIALAVNRPEGTVKSQMRLALQKLRHELQGIVQVD